MFKKYKSLLKTTYSSWILFVILGILTSGILLWVWGDGRVATQTTPLSPQPTQPPAQTQSFVPFFHTRPVFELIVQYDPTTDSLIVLKKEVIQSVGHLIYGDPAPETQSNYLRWEFEIEEPGGSLLVKYPIWIEKTYLNDDATLSDEIVIPIPYHPGKGLTFKNSSGKPFSLKEPGRQASPSIELPYQTPR